MLWVQRVAQRHRQTKTVQQLGPQFAFFGVHRAHQRKTRGVLLRDAVTLYRVDAAGGDVKQRIYQRIGQQINLIHVQHAVMGARHQARCQAQLALNQHGFHVQRAHQLLQAGRQRQSHKRRIW